MDNVIYRETKYGKTNVVKFENLKTESSYEGLEYDSRILYENVISKILHIF